MAAPRVPAGTGEAGSQLWRAVVGTFALEKSDLELLRQAVSVADHCARLESLVKNTPPVIKGRLNQMMPNPAWVELRAERRLLLALLGGLGLTANSVEVAEPKKKGGRYL